MTGIRITPTQARRFGFATDNGLRGDHLRVMQMMHAQVTLIQTHLGTGDYRKHLAEDLRHSGGRVERHELPALTTRFPHITSLERSARERWARVALEAGGFRIDLVRFTGDTHRILYAELLACAVEDGAL